MKPEISKIKPEEWEFVVERKRSVLFNSIMMHGLSVNRLGEFGEKIYTKNYMYLDGPWYEIREESARREKGMIEDYKKDRNFFKKYYDLAIDTISKEKKFWESIEDNDFSKSSDEELHSYIEKHIEGLHKINMFLHSIIIVENAISDEIKKYLNKEFGEDKAKKMFFDLTIPEKEGYFEQFNRKLVHAAASGDEGELKTIHSEFKWLKDQNGKWDYFSFEEIKEKVEDLIGQEPEKLIEMAEEEKKEIKEEFRKSAEAIKSKDIRELAKIASKLVHLRTYRTDVQYISMYKLKGLYEEAALRIGVNFEELHWFDEEMIVEALKTGKYDEEIIKKRKKEYGIVVVDGKGDFVYDEDFKKLKEIMIKEKKEVDEVKGMTAYPGNVKGNVKIVKNDADISKVNDGDVLLATMTRPNFIIAMEKAAAFVTDEGGITCHAAIISREMKKPCVIGTKVGTKVFKDGDIVDVDADNGIVRKIK